MNQKEQKKDLIRNKSKTKRVQKEFKKGTK